ncbi:MAG TPA: DUF2200 family protein [Allosphingosinicella sp.]|jgi:hypothetical protein
MREIRYLDKLVDELARGKKMGQICGRGDWVLGGDLRRELSIVSRNVRAGTFDGN